MSNANRISVAQSSQIGKLERELGSSNSSGKEAVFFKKGFREKLCSFKDELFLFVHDFGRGEKMALFSLNEFFVPLIFDCCAKWRKLWALKPTMCSLLYPKVSLTTIFYFFIYITKRHIAVIVIIYD